MKEPTTVKMGITQRLYKLRRRHGMLVAILRSKSRRTICARMVSARAPPVGLSDALRSDCDRGVSMAKGGAPGSLLPPSEPGFASLQGSLSKGLATEYQMSDRERLIAVEPGDFRGESVFSP